MILFKVEKLEMLLSEMNVPEDKKIVTPTTAYWLLGNISMKNSSHPRIEEATTILKEIVYRYRVR
tara:strand:+ start:1299 stop:1493 length:195 start_codon:yes stop_codon:yes gene_type:complete